MLNILSLESSFHNSTHKVEFLKKLELFNYSPPVSLHALLDLVWLECLQDNTFDPLLSSVTISESKRTHSRPLNSNFTALPFNRWKYLRSKFLHHCLSPSESDQYLHLCSLLHKTP